VEKGGVSKFSNPSFCQAIYQPNLIVFNVINQEDGIAPTFLSLHLPKSTIEKLKSLSQRELAATKPDVMMWGGGCSALIYCK
jgi:hypothetical protein